MATGRQVKALPTPNLNEAISIKLIGKAIRAKRTQEGLDNQTAALLCGVSVVTLSKVENASKGVRLESVLKIMASLGIKLTILPWEEKKWLH